MVDKNKKEANAVKLKNRQERRMEERKQKKEAKKKGEVNPKEDSKEPEIPESKEEAKQESRQENLKDFKTLPQNYQIGIRGFYDYILCSALDFDIYAKERRPDARREMINMSDVMKPQ